MIQKVFSELIDNGGIFFKNLSSTWSYMYMYILPCGYSVHNLVKKQKMLCTNSMQRRVMRLSCKACDEG
jgi:hypothetical protein